MLPHCGRTKGGYTMAEIIWNQGYTQNRELSWLEFNARVLAEAEDETVPLLERFKFLAIFTSNLDEFFMIRVGSLTDMAALEPNRRDSKSGLTASEQLDRIYAAVEPLYVRRGRRVPRRGQPPRRGGPAPYFHGQAGRQRAQIHQALFRNHDSARALAAGRGLASPLPPP